MDLKLFGGLAALALAACGGGAPSSPEPDYGPVARLEIVSGSAQSGVVGRELAQPVVVHALDDRGHDVKQQIINFRVVSGGGTVFAGSSITNEHGIAQERWTLGTDASLPQVLEARAVDTVTGQAIVFARFECTARPDAPARLAVRGDGQHGLAGEPLASPVGVRIEDVHGNPVAGVAASFAVVEGGGVVANAQVTSDAAGLAMTTWRLGDAPGANTLAATLVGVAPAALTATGSAGAPARLTLVAQPARAIAGAPLGSIAISALDAHDNPVPVPAGVSIRVASGPVGGALLGSTGAVAAGAVASFDALRIDRSGSYVLRVEAADLAVETSPIEVAAGPPSPLASDVAVAPPSVEAGGGAAVVTVTVRDDLGNPVPSAEVTLAVSGDGNSIVQPATPTDVGGVATGAVASTRAEEKAVEATAGLLRLAQVAALSVRPAPVDPASSTVTGPIAPVVADGVERAQVTVTLRDRFGNPVPDQAVAFDATGGLPSRASGVTGMNGEAAVSLTSTVAGVATLRATFAGGALERAVPFSAGPAAVLRLATTAEALEAGATLPVTVTALDAHGNVATSYRGTIAFSSSDPAAALPGPFALEAGDEGARTVAIELRTAGAQSLTVAEPGSAMAATHPLTVVAAAAAGLQVGPVAPAPVVAGEPFGVVVKVVDAFGNLAATGSPVSLELPPPARLSGTLGGTAVDGVARFEGLTLEQAGADYHLTASAPGLSSGTSPPFAVTAAPAARLSFASQPSSTVAGAPVSPAVEVVALDAFGNPAGELVPVALSLGGGLAGAVLLGTTSASTALGTAAFADLSIVQAGTGYVLTASAAGLAGAISAPFDVATDGIPSAAASDLAASPQQIDAGGVAFVTVTARDRYGNAIRGLPATVAATGTDNTLVQPVAPTDEAGQAVATLSSTRAEVKHLTASVGAVEVGTQAAVSVVGLAPHAVGCSLAVAPASAPADGTPVTLTAVVADQYGNRLAGLAVAFASTGGAILTQPPAATAADGVAVGTASALEPGTQVLSLNVDGRTMAEAPVDFTPPPPSPARSGLAASRPAAPADGVTAVEVVVTVRDEVGRPLAGEPVAIAFDGGGDVTPALATTSADGTAAFQIRSAQAAAGLVSGRVRPGGQAVLVAQTAAISFLACGAGQDVCGETCVDLQSTADHCGACGQVCAAGDLCAIGACVTPCPAGLVRCGGACIDPLTDAAFCGASGACAGASAGEACGAGFTCRAGACREASGYATHTQAWSGVIGGYVGRLAVTPDGRHAYVARYFGSTITKLDLRTGATASVAAGDSLHYDVALSPDGARLYVGGKLAIIDTATDTLIDLKNVDAYILKVHPGGEKLYAATDTGLVQVVSIPGHAVVKTIAGVAAGGNVGLAFTPDGAWCLVAAQSGEIFIIDATTDTLVKTLAPGGQLEHLAVAPDGGRAWAAAAGGKVVEVDVSAQTVAREAFLPPAVSRWAMGLAVSPDGQRLYVNGYQSTHVAVLSTSTLRPFAQLDLSGEPLGGIAVTPDGSKVVVVEQTIGNAAVFDVWPEATHPPVLATLAPASVRETQTLTLQVSASHPDGLPVALSASGLPANATFQDHLDGTGTLVFVPDVTQSLGSPYRITFRADDGQFFDFGAVDIEVVDQ